MPPSRNGTGRSLALPHGTIWATAPPPSIGTTAISDNLSSPQLSAADPAVPTPSRFVSSNNLPSKWSQPQPTRYSLTVPRSSTFVGTKRSPSQTSPRLPMPTLSATSGTQRQDRRLPHRISSSSTSPTTKTSSTRSSTTADAPLPTNTK